ncbi:MAG: DUF6933 domain-containing protein [Planctomycetota bacterium]
MPALPPSSDSVLGDWSLKPVELPQGCFFAGVNESTLMAVLFAEQPLLRVRDMLAASVGLQLATYGVDEGRIEAETKALQLAKLGKNRGRKLLGTLNEVAFQLELEAERGPITSVDALLDLQLRLNEIPHRASTPNCVFPYRAVAKAFGLGPVRRRR